ncbi:d-isomer specific 2-hydroxyacid dehydrogenase, NAD binding domain-containing protein [Sarocladium implicatum]|nr:d-isomer specific 2-hydroxyacid dehydrogenase, NAD binding domain-containing protein [Sarocladium implicatum]
MASQTTEPSEVPSLAILDDYLSISPPHFKHFSSKQINIEVFKSHVPQTSAEEQDAFVQKLKPFSIISTMRERSPFPGEVLRRLPNLKVLLCTGTQFETFDLKTAKELGITVVTAPGKGRTDQQVPAQARVQDIKKGGSHPATHHTWAMLLALARNVAVDDAAVKSGGWQTGLAMGLTGKTLGIVGFGRLGAAVARIGVMAFGMRIVCWSSSLNQQKADETAVQLGLPVEDDFGEKTFLSVDKETLFQSADVVSVHYVLSPRSRGIVGKGDLALMKTQALIVNTSRGPLIDEAALLDVAKAGRIRGVALDVFEAEPLPADSPWRTESWGQDGRSNVLLTPHMGYVEEGIMNNWYAETAENVERWLENKELLHRLV